MDWSHPGVCAFPGLRREGEGCEGRASLFMAPSRPMRDMRAASNLAFFGAACFVISTLLYIDGTARPPHAFHLGHSHVQSPTWLNLPIARCPMLSSPWLNLPVALDLPSLSHHAISVPPSHL